MFLHVTTHLPGRKRDGLLQEVGGRGFPSFFALDHDGNVVGQHAGPRNAAAFADTMEGAQRFIALRAKAAAGDAAAQVDYLLARARMGQVTTEEMKSEVKGLELTPEQQRAYRGILANTMMTEVQQTAVGERFAEMEREGLIPDDPSKRPIFYWNIFRYAQFKKDLKLMERAYAEVEAAWKSNPRYQRSLASIRRQLEQARANQ